jgi:hypothetical protein
VILFADVFSDARCVTGSKLGHDRGEYFAVGVLLHGVGTADV